MVRKEYSRFSNLVDSMTNGVILFNQSRVVTMSNPVIEKMTGLPSSSSSSSSLFALKDFIKLFPEADLDILTKKVLETGFSLNVKEAKLGRSFYDIFVTPIRDYDKNITGGAIILNEITENVQHTKEVERMNKVMVGRELKMKELKEEIQKLKAGVDR